MKIIALMHLNPQDSTLVRPVIEKFEGKQGAARAAAVLTCARLC
jgi:hypothetical protein